MELQKVIKSGRPAEILRYIRQHKIKASALVVEYGRAFVERGGSLGDEAYTVYEQVFLAAVEIGEQLLAQLLEKKFPGSSRVQRLKGVQAEANGDFDRAEALYRQLLEADPVDSLTWKRLVAVSKSRGDIPEAVRRLNEYVKVFQADLAAWQDLAELYALTGDLAGAAFCHEELLMFSPSNFVFHSRLAEVYYTLGGHENLRVARKHYAQSLELDPSGNNLRALYGMTTTCYAISTTSASRRDKADAAVNAALFAYAADRLKSHYADCMPSLLATVDSVLAAQEAAVKV